MSLGVHRVEKSPHSSAYFVQRYFGNYLIYPDALASYNEDLFKSRGGVYRQLLHSLDLISMSQVQLFRVFGASAVLHKKLKGSDTDTMPVEFFGDDFIDPTVKLNTGSWGGTYWMMKQGDEKVVFVDPDHFFSSSDQVLFHEKTITDEFFDYMESAGASYVFFSDHDEGSHYISL
jgi:hypothetical protein